MNLLGGATSLDSFLKAYKTNETESFFLYEWFDCTENLSNKELPPYDPYFKNLHNSNPLEKNYNDFENLVQSDLSREQAMAKLKMNNVPPTWAENHAFLQIIWDNEHKQSFADFLMWYNKKVVARTFETMLTMIEFYDNTGIEMLKLACALSIAATICLHKSTFAFSLKQTKFCRRKYEKIGLVDHP